MDNAPDEGIPGAAGGVGKKEKKWKVKEEEGIKEESGGRKG